MRVKSIHSVLVALAPPVTRQKLKDFDISRGQEVTITVTANGNPLPSCTWFHDDRRVTAIPNRIIMTDDGPTHILKLLDVELSDAGLYKVRMLFEIVVSNIDGCLYFRPSSKVLLAQQN